MKCKKARKLIVDFLCDELTPGDSPGLQEHLKECADCLKYKEEMQQTIMYIKDNEAQISEDMLVLDTNVINGNRLPMASRWPIWTAAAICAFSILLFAFVLSATEVQYADNTLSIRFRGAPGRQEMESELRAELMSEMDSIYQRTTHILEEYRTGQTKFEQQMAQELKDYGNALLQTIKLLNARDSQRDKQFAVALQQLEIRQNQIFDTIQKDLDTLAIETQKEFVRNYEAMATVTELVASGGY